MPSTLREIRTAVADLLKDRMELIATGGSTSTFQDTIELVQFDDTLVGSQILIESGANAGQLRTVTANVLSTQTLTLAPVLGSAIVAGVEASLYNLHGHGFSVRRYNSTIKSIVNSRDYKNAVDASYTFADPYDSRDPVLEVPADFIGIYAVQVALASYHDETIKYDIKKARYPNSNGWYLEPATRELSINGRERLMAHDGTVTLLGIEPHPAPVDDDDTISLDFEWVLYSVAAQLCANKSPQHDRWAVEFLQKAAGRESFVVPEINANLVYLPESSS